MTYLDLVNDSIKTAYEAANHDNFKTANNMLLAALRDVKMLSNIDEINVSIDKITKAKEYFEELEQNQGDTFAQYWAGSITSCGERDIKNGRYKIIKC